LYNDDSKNYFEVLILKNSIFAQEILEDIQSGNIPESFLAIEIVKPEVFSISSPQPSPEGEGVIKVDLT